jgi:hypothetical protein
MYAETLFGLRRVFLGYGKSPRSGGNAANMPPALRPASSSESLQECPVRIADDPLRFRLQLTFAWLSQTHGMIAK